MTASSTTSYRPPSPEPTTPAEFIDGLPIGFGSRVPMLICSPWTRGGYVDSNLYDHTSMLRFLETWTGVSATNITAWRRSLSGDLTAAFDFARPDFSIPDLPDTVPLIEQSDQEQEFPPVSTPALGADDAGAGARQSPAPSEQPPGSRRRHGEPVERPGRRHTLQTVL